MLSIVPLTGLWPNASGWEFFATFYINVHCKQRRTKQPYGVWLTIARLVWFVWVGNHGGRKKIPQTPVSNFERTVNNNKPASFAYGSLWESFVWSRLSSYAYLCMAIFCFVSAWCMVVDLIALPSIGKVQTTNTTTHHVMGFIICLLSVESISRCFRESSLSWRTCVF